MKEISFRGKSETNGEWIYGFYYYEISRESHGSDRMREKHHIFTINYDKFVIPETVGQYTGLKDKNGTKIFEGDIVRATSQLTSKSDRYCLVFDEARLHFGFRVSRHGYFYNIDELLNEELGDEIDFEVIGNIYDNPELLEVADGR